MYEMQHDALPDVLTLRESTGHSAGRRRCTLGNHKIPKGGVFSEWVGLVDGEFGYEVHCWGCFDAAATGGYIPGLR